MKRKFSAVGLQYLLTSTITIMIIGGGVLFSTVNGMLGKSALDTNHAQINAELGRDTIDQLKLLDTYSQKNQKVIERTADIVADSKQYSYQDQIVRDINTYAGRAGVKVLGYGFDQKSQKSSAIVAGLKTIDATVTLGSPIPYKNYLKFLKAIEQNLTKMQVRGITVAPNEAGSSDVSNPTIVLEVYVR